MAVRLYSEDEIFAITLGYFSVLFPGEDLSEFGYFGLMARAFAQVAVLCQYGIEQADNDGTPAYQQAADGTVRSKCSTEALDAWAFVFGLPSGVPGIYGRRGATISTGGSGIPTGTAGTLVPAGTLAVDSTGQVTVKTTAAVTLVGTPNTASVPFVSVTTGAAANLPALSTLTWESPPAGLGASVILTSALTGAADRESDSDLVARIIRRIQSPPRGGTAADFRAWTEESTDSNGASNGIVRAYVYPLRSGLGSVDTVVTVKGSGTSRVPGAATITAVQAYLNTKKPVTATAKVFPPFCDPLAALRIYVRVIPNPGKNGLYQYDYDDLNTPYVIQSHTVNTITLVGVAANLAAAVAAGAKPRIQISLSAAGASPKPYQLRVVSIAANTLTLDRNLPFAPVDGTDFFFAGGSVVDIIAQRILDYVDSLGPSIQSGTADLQDPWSSTVSVSKLVDVCFESRDTDGTALVADMISPNAVQIAVGAGFLTPVSYVPRDIGTGIELAYLKSGGISVVKQ
jgi:hypothetical protein